jgi:hypothetical protein
MRTSSLQIRTPEGIVFSQLLAGPVTRFLAWFVDLLCIIVVMMALGIAISVLQLISANLEAFSFPLDERPASASVRY